MAASALSAWQRWQCVTFNSVQQFCYVAFFDADKLARRPRGQNVLFKDAFGLARREAATCRFRYSRVTA